MNCLDNTNRYDNINTTAHYHSNVAIVGVGLSMMLDGEEGESFSGRKPSKRAHRTGVGAILVCS